MTRNSGAQSYKARIELPLWPTDAFTRVLGTMVLPPTYSRRKRQSQGDRHDVYRYDGIPNTLRVQIIHIFSEAMGKQERHNYESELERCFACIVRSLQKEFGVFTLVGEYTSSRRNEYFLWIQKEKDIDRLIDGYELGLRMIDNYIRQNWDKFQYAVETPPDNAIAEANARFHEAGIGYQYVSGDVVRVDSELIHSEVVLPALVLLHDKKFAAAEKEYLEAHEAYRHGRFEDCIVSCGKAFESVFKVIGGERGWQIKETDPASRLIQAAVDAGFLANYSQASLNNLKGLMESSTPTVRNKVGGHGAGAAPRQVPGHLAAFQLHQTAAVIRFLAEQHAAMP